MGSKYESKRDIDRPRRYVKIINNNSEEIKTLYRQQRNIEDLFPPIIKFLCYSNLIYIADASKGFHIEIFDMYGNRVREIHKSYQKLKTKKSDIEKKFAYLNTIPSIRRNPAAYLNRLKAPEYMPPMKDFYISDDHIYVKTSVYKNKKEEWVVLGLTGNEKRRIYLPETKYNQYCFRANKLYFLHENEDEETWKLYREKIY